MGATLNYSTHEKAAPTANTQIKILTDLVKSLLEATEGQTSAMEELKREHAKQIEVLTRTFTQQIETLKGQVAKMTEKIKSQLSNIQPPRSGSLSCAEVARTPPSSRPSNVRTLTSIGTTPSTMTNTLYCTIDTSRVGEEERSKAQPWAVRKGPILYLFYNANLIEACKTERTEAVGYINDVSILAGGPTTQRNCKTLKAIHQTTEKWALQHGSQFTPAKYKLIHFTRDPKANTTHPLRLPHATIKASPSC
jgi:hypothetical protein